MSALRRQVFVEGHGEVRAMHNLLARLSHRVGDVVPWSVPRRWNNLHQWENPGRGGIQAAVEFARRLPDTASVLLIRDADDACPRRMAPVVAARLEALRAPFPVAYVLLKPEFEVLFLPCLDRMAGAPLDGRPGLAAHARWDLPDWEARRGLKEWLTGRFPEGSVYKPAVDQLPLTRMIDLDQLAAAEVPCFGTLERAIAFLVNPPAGRTVYP